MPFRHIAFRITACALLFATMPSQADVYSDWFEGKLGNWAAPPAGGQVRNLKFSHPAPPVSIIPPVIVKGLVLLEAKTDGQLKFKEYGAGTLHGPRDGFKAIREGLSDWATCYAQFEGRGFEMSRVFEQPFIAPVNPMLATMVAHDLAEKYFRPEFERQETYYGNMMAFSSADIMTKKPVRRLEDLRGMKVVAQGFPPDAARALGFSLVNIPYPEVYTAIQQGTVDAVIWFDVGFIPFKIYEVARFYTRLGISGSTLPTCINRKLFDGLSPELKRALYNVQQPLAMAMAKITQIEFGKKAADIYKEKGVEMIELAPAELERIKVAARQAVDKWVKDQEAAGRPGKQLLDDLAKSIAKFEKMGEEEMFRRAVEQPAPGLIKF
ncbi:MAG: TRAP transporter substrate-binding protein DctP [Burkholderiales bacterium]